MNRRKYECRNPSQKRNRSLWRSLTASLWGPSDVIGKTPALGRRCHRPLRLESLEERSLLAAWVAQGPGPILNGPNIQNVMPNDEAVGAINTLAAHPTDADVLYVGGVNGGNVSGLKGPFVNIAGGCTLVPRFEPGIANPLPPRFAAVTGDQTLVSTNFMLRRVRAQIGEWRVIYQ